MESQTRTVVEGLLAQQLQPALMQMSQDAIRQHNQLAAMGSSGIRNESGQLLKGWRAIAADSPIKRNLALISAGFYVASHNLRNHWFKSILHAL